MAGLFDLLNKSGDHHHSHGIVHTMIEGAIVGGVAALLAHLVAGGMGEIVQKWQDGQPHKVDPSDLRSILGEDKLNAIAQSSGLSPEDVLKHLSDHLPGAALSHAQTAA